MKTFHIMFTLFFKRIHTQLQRAVGNRLFHIYLVPKWAISSEKVIADCRIFADVHMKIWAVVTCTNTS